LRGCKINENWKVARKNRKYQAIQKKNYRNKLLLTTDKAETSTENMR